MGNALDRTDSISFSDYERDMDYVRNIVLRLKDDLDRTKRDAVRMLWAATKAAGGQIRVPASLLVLHGTLQQDRDIENDCIVLSAKP